MNSRRFSRLPSTIAIAGLTAVLIAACGASKKPPASNSGSASSNSGGAASRNSGISDAYRYSACMRTHGVSNFKDPHVSQHGNSVAVAIHVDPAITGSPAFKSAQHACAHILPNGGNGPTQAQIQAHTDAILAFAKCMRQHGFPRFPDPNSQGQLPPSALSKAGINLQQPAIKPAADACVSVTHGIITKADINQAIANPNGSGSQSSSSGG
ncbi:MAG: hypothetical protein KGL16_09110 [Acidobacteriota bacterium]|nr:hypothetical protein [Acidobacteriota bacterium]